MSMMERKKVGVAGKKTKTGWDESGELMQDLVDHIFILRASGTYWLCKSCRETQSDVCFRKKANGYYLFERVTKWIHAHKKMTVIRAE